MISSGNYLLHRLAAEHFLRRMQPSPFEVVSRTYPTIPLGLYHLRVSFRDRRACLAGRAVEVPVGGMGAGAGASRGASTLQHVLQGACPTACLPARLLSSCTATQVPGELCATNPVAAPSSYPINTTTNNNKGANPNITPITRHRFQLCLHCMCPVNCLPQNLDIRVENDFIASWVAYLEAEQGQHPVLAQQLQRYLVSAEDSALRNARTALRAVPLERACALAEQLSAELRAEAEAEVVAWVAAAAGGEA